MFTKKKKEVKEIVATVSNDSYRRWLRAHRPDFNFFFSRSELEQEQLAIIGDEYTEEMVVSLGYALNDPEGADAAISATAGKSAGEEALTMRLMDSVAQTIVANRERARAAEQAQAPQRTMAGVVNSPLVQKRPIDPSKPRPTMKEFLGAKKRQGDT